jgi:hypothetical protein
MFRTAQLLQDLQLSGLVGLKKAYGNAPFKTSLFIQIEA